MLYNLESVLHEKLGNDVEIVNWSTKPMLKLGDNFGSTIRKVYVVVRRVDTGKMKVLNLVAKMPPPTDFQWKVFDTPYTFRKETFFYQDLIPSFKQLGREQGLSTDQLIDITSEFYGARFSLSPYILFDKNAVILIENLKELGYYIADRRKGLDVEHARAAVIALTQFHGLGMAMKQHKPAEFSMIKAQSKSLEMSGVTFDESNNFYTRILVEDKVTGIHGARLTAAMAQEASAYLNSEPWATIVHADLWVNNILYRKRGELYDLEVKFVDFQNYLYQSPMRDLIFLLVASGGAQVFESDNFDMLIDCYYQNLLKLLGRLNCDLGPFKRSSFDERLRMDAYQEFPHCPYMIKTMTTDNEQIKDFESFVTDRKLNTDFWERLRWCVNKYVEKGWLL